MMGCISFMVSQDARMAAGSLVARRVSQAASLIDEEIKRTFLQLKFAIYGLCKVLGFMPLRDMLSTRQADKTRHSNSA